MTHPYPKTLDAAWRDDAACLGVETGLFFARDYDAATVLARQVCGRCPVRGDCLEWALETRSDYGVLGGMTGRARVALRVRRRRMAYRLRRGVA